MTDRQALLSAAGKQRPYKAVNIKPPAMPGDIYFVSGWISIASVKKVVYKRIKKCNNDKE